jgi:nucleoside-diphosphate-sugar epimerase
MDSLANARVLVTGASGFIGSHVIRRLVADGAEVHGLTSTVSAVYPVRLVDLREQIKMHEGNLIDRSAMDAVVDKARPEYVLHLGAFTHVGKSWQRVDECVQANVQGTVNLLQALARHDCRRFVYTGTSEIYGDIEVPFREDAKVNPVSPYSVSKYAGERFCRMFHQSYGWPVVMLRPFNAYGPAQTPDRIIPEIIVRALRGQELKMTQGFQTREFNYVEDIAEGFVLAATAPDVEGEVLNVGCGEEVSMRDLAKTVLDLMGNPIEAQFGALPERPTEIHRMFSDSTKARAALRWTPRHSLAEGLQKTIAWYSDQLIDPGSQFFSPPRAAESP